MGAEQEKYPAERWLDEAVYTYWALSPSHDANRQPRDITVRKRPAYRCAQVRSKVPLLVNKSQQQHLGSSVNHGAWRDITSVTARAALPTVPSAYKGNHYGGRGRDADWTLTLITLSAYCKDPDYRF